MIRAGITLLLLGLSYVHGMEPIIATNLGDRYQHIALSGLALIAAGLVVTKIGTYCLTKEDSLEVPQDIWLKYENIRKRLKTLKENIHYKNRSVSEFEKERIALLQEIMPDVQLEHKSEREIHRRLMLLLCPVHAPLAHAIGDVNQALLDLKRRRNNKNQDEQQELEIKGYVL